MSSTEQFCAQQKPNLKTMIISDMDFLYKTTSVTSSLRKHSAHTIIVFCFVLFHSCAMILYYQHGQH